MNKSESIVQLARALTLAQKDMGGAKTDELNPFLLDNLFIKVL